VVSCCLCLGLSEYFLELFEVFTGEDVLVLLRNLGDLFLLLFLVQVLSDLLALCLVDVLLLLAFLLTLLLFGFLGFETGFVLLRKLFAHFSFKYFKIQPINPSPLPPSQQIHQFK
jgi:hypothetical protein